jgi:hypothetical protein
MVGMADTADNTGKHHRTITITLLFEHYKQDYIIKQSLTDAEAAESMQGLQGMLEQMYEGTDADKVFKLRLVDADNTQFIYATHCIGGMVTITKDIWVMTPNGIGVQEGHWQNTL